MINLRNVKLFCTDYTQIENYEKALNDDTQTWICHHKNGITLNCGHEKLIELGLYYDRPPEELIFVTSGEHNKLHKSGTTASEETRKKQSEVNKGSNNPRAKQCTINGKTYGCIKDAWREICPELTYETFLRRYTKGVDVTVKSKQNVQECTINGKTYGCLKDAWRDINPQMPYSTFTWKYQNNKL